MKFIPLFCFLTFSLVPISFSTARASEADLNSLSLKVASIAPVDDAWRQALPRDPEAATDAYMARLSPLAKARSDAYFEGGYWIQLWELLLCLTIALLLLSSRISTRVRTWTEKVTQMRALQLILYSIFLILAFHALSFPFTVYESFFREHEYGLSNLTFLNWLKEDMIRLLLILVFGSVAISALYGVIRKFPRTWHMGATVLSIGFSIIILLLSPVYLDPLFNQYQPLAEGPTKDAILSMARASGVPAHDVYEFDASKQSDRISANVSGFMGTTSIRLNDNLLKRTTLPEIKGVMGHEMGHYVMNHIYKMIMEFAWMSFILFSFLVWSFEKIRSKKGEAWGVQGVGDIAGLPLLIALMNVFFFVMTPINNTLIRTQETEADIFGLNASREPDGFAEVDLKLTEYRKSDPGPIEEFIFFDHPSPRKRIFSAMRWKAENWKSPSEEKK